MLSQLAASGVLAEAGERFVRSPLPLMVYLPSLPAAQAYFMLPDFRAAVLNYEPTAVGRGMAKMGACQPDLQASPLPSISIPRHF
jgi:hypothetical protein